MDDSKLRHTKLRHTSLKHCLVVVLKYPQIARFSVSQHDSQRLTGVKGSSSVQFASLVGRHCLAPFAGKSDSSSHCSPAVNPRVFGGCQSNRKISMPKPEKLTKSQIWRLTTLWPQWIKKFSRPVVLLWKWSRTENGDWGRSMCRVSAVALVLCLVVLSISTAVTTRQSFSMHPTW